ncbi:MAG: HEPN domain-containing protein [Carboxylicivirga sp.]|nr:HEPN domain-containing protein [Carboxylicivirga sp.]
MNGKIGCIDVWFHKSFDWSLRKSNVFETDWRAGKNQVIQFWNERFMPNTFENPEGLSFENMDNFVVWFDSPIQHLNPSRNQLLFIYSNFKATIDYMTNLKHLPENKQDEIKELAELLSSSDKVLMVVLFGSYARGSWVQDRYIEKGILFEYESDYDLLVILDHDDMSLQNHFENRIKKELINTGKLKTPVACIFHGIDQVNEALSTGHYFFSDIKKDGIVLVRKGTISLVEPRVLAPKELALKAQEYFDQWFLSANEFLISFNSNLKRGSFNIAAFELHQATERLYVAILLVFTGYRPKTHSLDALSARVEILDERFKEVFPRNTDEEKNLFRLLHRAYIDARYKMDEYQITKKDLNYLDERVKFLQKLTIEICLNRIEDF